LEQRFLTIGKRRDIDNESGASKFVELLNKGSGCRNIGVLAGLEALRQAGTQAVSLEGQYLS
jgi:hypothetical protein